jgi:hypothetical protein
MTEPCPHCGGIHYGDSDCPYLESDPGGMIAAHRKRQTAMTERLTAEQIAKLLTKETRAEAIVNARELIPAEWPGGKALLLDLLGEFGIVCDALESEVERLRGVLREIRRQERLSVRAAVTSQGEALVGISAILAKEGA